MPGTMGRQIEHHACVDVSRIHQKFSGGENPDFRYTLCLPSRDRQGMCKRVAVVLKNPSAANALKADSTIRIVEEYVHKHFPNARELVILNLFAYRATYPKDVKSHMVNGGDVIGPCNDYYIRHYCACATYIIPAWGGNSQIPKGRYSDRIDEVCRMLRPHRNKLWRVPKSDGSIPDYPLHGLRWSYGSCPRRCRIG